MIDVQLHKAIERTVSHFGLVPHFSERRLLLFVGDILMIALATWLAFWVHSILG
jgi:hypothetical protein